MPFWIVLVIEGLKDHARVRICYDSCETVTSLLHQTPLGFSLPPSLIYIYIYIYIYMSIYSLVKDCIVFFSFIAIILELFQFIFQSLFFISVLVNTIIVRLRVVFQRDVAGL